MTHTKDEVILSRVVNRTTGLDNLLLIFPNDLTEAEALDMVDDGFRLEQYEREKSTVHSHWFDRLMKDPGSTYVVFRKIAQP